uniref:Uncharacterized protein n=1 Tax=viral metagenome TaxID=1070528 RepID=A0A6C0AMS8_9ZZZZ
MGWLNTEITQGSYWRGAQIPYWLYMILVTLPFTGLLGIDHFALRSPMTAVLKVISIIPLFGFWYFYDIAQVFGEADLVKQYGIGIPFYGPVGIGQGILSYDPTEITGTAQLQTGGAGKPPGPRPASGPPMPVTPGPPVAVTPGPPVAVTPGPPVAVTPKPPVPVTPGPPILPSLSSLSQSSTPKDQNGLNGSSPWLFIIYALATLLCFTFPINKFIAGDFALGILNIIFFLSVIGIPLVIIQGLYDIYNLIFNTKSIFETGITPIPGVSFILNVFKIGTGFATRVVTGVATGVATGAAKEEVKRLGLPPQKDLSSAVNQLAEKLPEAAGAKLVDTAHKVEKVATGELGAASSAIGAVEDVAGATSAVSKELKDPAVVRSILTGTPSTSTAALTVPSVPSSKSTHRGGSLTSLITPSIPSIPVLLFSVGLLAFSGYVFYIFKNTYRKPEKSDDPPRESRAVRGSPKSVE